MLAFQSISHLAAQTRPRTGFTQELQFVPPIPLGCSSRLNTVIEITQTEPNVSRACSTGNNMVKTNQKSSSDSIVIADGEELELRNRNLAAFLAWILPGAGHFYQRRYLKSTIFSICVFATFLIGMFVSGGRCVYASWNATEKRWQFVLQSGVGFAAVPAMIQSWGRDDAGNAPLGEMMLAPLSERELDDWNRETASGFDMGTLYTMIAGLLNVMAIFDAYAGPLAPPVPKSKRGPGDEDGPPDESSTEPE